MEIDPLFISLAIDIVIVDYFCLTFMNLFDEELKVNFPEFILYLFAALVELFNEPSWNEL